MQGSGNKGTWPVEIGVAVAVGNEVAVGTGVHVAVGLGGSGVKVGVGGTGVAVGGAGTGVAVGARMIGVAVGAAVAPGTGVLVAVEPGTGLEVGSASPSGPGVDVPATVVMPGTGVGEGVWPGARVAGGRLPFPGVPGLGVAVDPRPGGAVALPGTLPPDVDEVPVGVALRGVILIWVALRRASSSAAALMIAGLSGASRGRTPSAE
jgi:hypothetical protein